MDLCLSCKGCKSECPSNVDIAKLKAEFLQHYYDTRGVPLRARLVAHFADSARLASLAPWAWNFVFGTPALRRLANRAVGFHPDRTIPLLGKHTLRSWFRKRRPPSAAGGPKVLLFCDEFTDANDTEAGKACVELLEGLGYNVRIPTHVESGRASLSKGLLRRARTFAQRNVAMLAPHVSEASPLIGIEPSAILTFRDEYPELLRGDEQRRARALAPHCLMVEEFLAGEMDAGRVRREAFRQGGAPVHLHGHCQQKAIASLTPTVRLFETLLGREVRIIPSGCCGMAGSFGYEAEHFDLSQRIGELVLFPRVRATPPEETIAAPGTSCRHQIHDGTGQTALHPVQILKEALLTHTPI
jgi:Fe-S oxidoreductase